MGFQGNAFQSNAFQGIGGAAPEVDPSRQRLLVGVGRAIVIGLFMERLFRLWNEYIGKA